MQLCNTSVVSLEKSQEVFTNVALVFIGQRADNAKVDSDVLRVILMLRRDKDISRVHVRVKEIMVKHLPIENLDTVFSQFLHIHTDTSHLIHITNGYATDTLLHEYIATRVIPVDLRDI